MTTQQNATQQQTTAVAAEQSNAAATTTAAANYAVKLHTDSSKVEQPTHRLSVLRWKDTKNEDGSIKKKLSPTLCVSVSMLPLSATPASLQKLLRFAFESQQDAVIRSLVEDSIEAGAAVNSLTIAETDITIEAVAAFFAEQATGNRLSNKLIGDWFDKSLKDKLLVKLAEVMKIGAEPTEGEAQKLEKALADHRKYLVSLASPRASMPTTLAGQLKKAVELAETTDSIADKLTDKLNLFLAPVSATLEYSL